MNKSSKEPDLEQAALDQEHLSPNLSRVIERVEAAKRDAYKKASLPRELTDELWRKGVLYHLLDDLQKQIYHAYYSLPDSTKKAVSLVARRVGKTFTYTCIAIERALANPGSQQHYVSGTAVQVKNMLLPTFRTILESCPQDMKPKWRAKDEMFVFPHNGSTIKVSGCGDQLKADRMRGNFSDGVFIDEAGYVENLKYVADSVFLPMLKGRPGAKILMYSNAPLTPAHDISDFITRAKAENAYFHASVYDSPRYSPQEIEEFAEAAGGFDSTEWIREYLCEIVVDENFSVLPEWSGRALTKWVQVPDSYRARAVEPMDTEEVICDPLVRVVTRPKYFDIYTSMDLGWAPDLTSVLTMYWDYTEARLVVEGELELSKMTTNDLAEGVRVLEEECWGDYWDFQQSRHGMLTRKPYRRVMDVDKQIQADLGALHGLQFTQANNTDLHSQINRLRQLIRAGKLVVHPRCVNLINHLNAAYWNTARTKFARPRTEPIPGSIYYGHFDHVSALQLGYTHVNQSHDPFPTIPLGVSPSTHMLPKHLRARQARRGGFSKLARRMRPLR